MDGKRTPIDANYLPVSEIDAIWWEKHVLYSKFNRLGIDVVCASFENPNAKANIIFVTGWSESFLKYSEVIHKLYDSGFSIYTYDHQSQGLSGRWLAEQQSTWIHNFDDYVDDFIFFVTTISRETSNLPMYLLAHSMGGLVSSIAMSRLPTLINRAVLSAPMFRHKCALKCFNYAYPLPQQIAYWITVLSCRAGLGMMHVLGFFKEKSGDQLPLNVTTSDTEQLEKWRQLRQKYPQIMSTCVTNDWALQSIRAEKKFETRFEFVQTNTLILSAENDLFVYNRAMAFFSQRAPKCKIFIAPNSLHEVLYETEPIRNAALEIVKDFFKQKSDNVEEVNPRGPFYEYDKATPIYSLPEKFIRAAGIVISTVGIIAGVTMIFSSGRRGLK
jgi:lysophospholipase